LTNYEQLRTPPRALGDGRLDLVIADEAQWLRNLGAAVTRGVRSLKFSRFWALTGTPIERDTTDLVSLIAIMDPQRFSRDDGRLPAAVLRARARPYVLRRHKDQVLSDLPDVLESREYLELLPAQRSAYLAKLQEVRPSGQSEGDTLRLLNELRQICDFDPVTRTGVKVNRTTELLSQIRSNGEKAVVFSVYIEPLHLLSQGLAEAGVQALTLTGDLDSSERDTTIANFRSQSDVTALLASIRVAGVGLTLTDANHVLFLNQWWNPSTNSQARDRVVRIGQSRKVHVYTYCCRNTVEDALERILAEKSALYAGVVDELAEDDVPAGTQLALIRDLARETLKLAGSVSDAGPTKTREPH
jgi:SNF2 family DNA or RNA helicase